MGAHSFYFMLGLCIFSPLWVSLIAFNSTPVLLSPTYSCIPSSPSWSARLEKNHVTGQIGPQEENITCPLVACQNQPLQALKSLSSASFLNSAFGDIILVTSGPRQKYFHNDSWQILQIGASPLDLESQLLNVLERTTAYSICLKFSSFFPPY